MLHVIKKNTGSMTNCKGFHQKGRGSCSSGPARGRLRGAVLRSESVQGGSRCRGPRCCPAPSLRRYMGAVGSSRVMCDNVPGLVSRQRQLCRRHPEAMLSIGRGVAAWTAECQHQFRRHRWDCNALERGQRLLGRVLLRSESAITQGLPGPGRGVRPPRPRPG